MANKLLLIGIDEYINQIPLTNCVKNILDFKEILLDKYDFDESHSYELLNEEATNIKIQDTLNGFVKSLEKTDNLLIAYFGHGAFAVQSDRSFWIPVDGDKSYTTWISNETIVTIINKINAKNILLIANNFIANSLINKYYPNSNYKSNNLSSRWILTSGFKDDLEIKFDFENNFLDLIFNFLKLKEKDFSFSELVDYINKNFTSNYNQTFQAAPLMTAAHRGGEFVFSIRQETDQRKFKGYKDFRKTLQLYKKNSEFKELAIVEDKSNKIGFQLFQENDVVIKKVTYYLYLYEGIIQSRTLQYLKEKFKEIFREKNLIIFLTKERYHTSLDTRKNNIVRKFMPLSHFYIDDFIREQCTPKFLLEHNSKYLTNSNFILPSYRSEAIRDNIEEYIHEWFKKEDEPILVVIGAGGIGKTTFAQYIADQILTLNAHTFVLFIDSVQIKDVLLKRRKYSEQINLYNFYEALYEIDDLFHEKLNEDLFRINLDAGNILLIIDGLDEVISKIPNFNVNAFLRYINENTREIGGGKIIITCRTHFWDNTEDFDSKFNVIELLPFNREQTLMFFNKSFKSDSYKIRNALKLSEDFKYPNTEGENIFHPYVLDIIRSIILTEQETLNIDLSNFSSQILKSTVKNDYIIYRICHRERKRIGQIEVDEQLTFFIHLAIEKRGTIETENFKAEIELSLKKYIDKTNIEAFKAHPFLSNANHSTGFKYDFLVDYFRGVYLAEYFDYESKVIEPSLLFINLIGETCWYGSPMILDISNRMSHWNENDIYFCSDLIEQMANLDIDLSLKRKAIGNYFNVCLAINFNYRPNNIEENTALLTSLFQKRKGNLANFSIINVNNVDHKLRFDFSNLTLSSCYFDNYNSFWDCKFNELTFFIDCHLLNLNSSKKNNTLTQSNFQECVTDETISRALVIGLQGKVDRKGNAKLFLDDFFHLFLSNGRLERQSENDVIKVRFGAINKYAYGYKTTIKTLKNLSVIILYDNIRGTKVEIVDEYKEDVFKFVKDGTMSKIVSALIDEFAKI